MFERLTARSPKNNMAYLINVRSGEQGVESPYPNTLRCIMDSFNRLAAYEDSGLSPEQVQELVKAKAEGRLVEVVRCGDCRKKMKAECHMCGVDCDGFCTGGPDSDQYCSFGEKTLEGGGKG